MTEKLYLKDSYLFSCETTVTEIIDEGDYLSVAFLQTPFFPGGGGQPSDKGCVNDIHIKGAYEKDGIIYHQMKDKHFPYSVEDNVTLSVSSDIRFERMRAHSGEHIVSGIAHNMYGVDNVGFHMDENGLMTVDFNKYLERDELNRIEYAANRCVMDNVKINADVYPVENVTNIEYRSKIEFDDDVRIVEIEGIDKCACCAPHLKFTGEVGFIKILSSASHRGGVRITMICGSNSYFELEKRYRQILDISALLCSRYDDAVTAVSELIENNKIIKYEKEQIRYDFLQFCASEIQTSEIIIDFFDNFSIDDLRIINNILSEKCKYLSLLFSGNDSVGYCYCIYSDKLKLDKFARDFNSLLNGSGGGKGTMLQGKVKSTKDDIVKFVNEMKVEKYENA